MSLQGPTPARRAARFGELARVNREPASRNARLIAPILHTVLRIWTRRTWLGGHNLPLSGPAIVVANHISNLDPPLLAEALAYQGRWPHFLAKASLFKWAVVGRLLAGAEQIPVLRGSVQARDSLVHAERALNEGKVVVIYPEGTITGDPDEWPMAAHTGAARLALRLGVTVIPVGQWGANYALPSFKNHPFRLRRWPISIVFGEPIDLGEFGGAWEDRQVARAATVAIMDTITGLVEELRNEAAPRLRWHPRRKQHVERAEAVI